MVKSKNRVCLKFRRLSSYAFGNSKKSSRCISQNFMQIQNICMFALYYAPLLLTLKIWKFNFRHLSCFAVNIFSRFFRRKEAQKKLYKMSHQPSHYDQIPLSYNKNEKQSTPYFSPIIKLRSCKFEKIEPLYFQELHADSKYMHVCPVLCAVIANFENTLIQFWPLIMFRRQYFFAFFSLKGGT